VGQRTDNPAVAQEYLGRALLCGRRCPAGIHQIGCNTMSTCYEITHRTTYRYAEPVRFGEHRVQFRPRDSHDQRVLATDLQVRPEASVRLVQDPQSNSVALVQPLHDSATLEFVCSFIIEKVATPDLHIPVAPSALLLPAAYPIDERFDLEPCLRPHYDDPEDVLGAWARQFICSDGPTVTRALLDQMSQHIGATLRYQVRHEEGTQPPLVTLAKGSGTCRDYALLMIEAARRLGLAARFISGYLYDPALDGDSAAQGAAGSTHAWLQVYLPGPGWVAFDPTNQAQGGTRLIRVAVARHPAQATPVAGSWFGPPGAYLGMDVDVQVRRQADWSGPAILQAAGSGAAAQAQARGTGAAAD
jgi:transglutaminase-like putative cysteine protease